MLGRRVRSSAEYSRTTRPLLELWPGLEQTLPVARLAELPTPVEPAAELARCLGHAGFPAYVKRDDRTSPVYGGNKVRTLEMLFGRARASGATRVWATGAYGSNHAVATVLHAPRAGLSPGVLLFPQPASWTTLENLRVVLASGCALREAVHWSTLPFGMLRTAGSEHRSGTPYSLMTPGGAVPFGALGYVSAGLELARQVASGLLPAPEKVVVGVGSTCTSAGLLVGFAHAARLGIGFSGAPPELVSVRVTPWPVASHTLIVDLAARTSRLLAKLAGAAELALDRRTLGSRLTVDGRFLGRGYGEATPEGLEAITLFRQTGLCALDATYRA